ncbi:MAG TPA: carbohydrate binding domain-containing protein [Chitinispirillaceae bacterium]|nr:carbohydrate binding domain-containing protein [Chitinispirillaceae bacterium]
MMFTADAAGANAHNFAIILGAATGVYDFDSVEITEEAPSEGGSIYQNGDFEKGGTGWNLQAQGTGAATATYPTEGAKSGSKFCRVNVTALPENPYEVQLQDESWTCQKGGQYTFTFYAKADNDTSKIQFIAQTGSTRNYATLSSKDEILTKEWTMYSLIFSTDSIAGLDSVNVNITCGYNLGVYDFDSLSLTLTSVPVHHTKIATMNKPQQFAINILPGQLQCVLNDNTYVNKINIHDVMGRVFYSGSFAGNKAGSYILPRPASGTWIVKVNSDKTEQNQKIVLP